MWQVNSAEFGAERTSGDAREGAQASVEKRSLAAGAR